VQQLPYPFAAQMPEGSVYSAPLLSGDAGIAQTIRAMRQLASAGEKDPLVRRQAVEILRSVPAYDKIAELNAIFHWVLRNIRYTEDPPNKEMLHPVRDLLNLRAGDCDDFVVLLAALLGSVGFQTRAVTVAADPADPSQFTHVYLEALVGGEWIALDAARRDAQFGLEPGRIYRKKFWNFQDSSSGDVRGLAGLGCAAGGSCHCGGKCGGHGSRGGTWGANGGRYAPPAPPLFGTVGRLGEYDELTGEYTDPSDIPCATLDFVTGEYYTNCSVSSASPPPANTTLPVYSQQPSSANPGTIINLAETGLADVISSAQGRGYYYGNATGVNSAAPYGAISPYGASPYGVSSLSMGLSSLTPYLPLLLIAGVAVLVLRKK
jgi:Transglutaminase-like superfamily